MIKKRFILGVIFLVVVFTGCNKDKNDPGYDYFPDMFYSNAYESYTPNPNFPDGKTLREPVAGTISREMIPFPYEKTDEDRILAGRELKNPMGYSSEDIARGKEMYGRFCAMCHGETGDGKGFLFTSGKYPFPPATLLSEKVVNIPDGEIYHSITVGYGIMGPHGAMINQDDRWKIISYIRKELQNQ